jgi:hypothetical protein
MIEFIPYFVIAMIIYDLSIHFVYFTNRDKWILKRKLNWWPAWWGNKYQIFWISFWTLALILMISYVLLR